MNLIGEGAWSDIVKLKAAGVPLAPPKPTYISSTEDSVTIGLENTKDNGGSYILGYKIKRDAGDLSSPVDIEETDYDGASPQFTITGLTPGVKYRFRYFATNEFGDSEPSLTVTVAASTLPEPPIDIEVDWTLSSKTSLFIRWSEPLTHPDAPI